MESQAITGRRNRRGFNLIEAAIVLGVVGLVVGGIWVAAISVSGAIRTSQLATGIDLAISKLHRVYGRPPLSPLPPSFTLSQNIAFGTSDLPSGFSFDGIFVRNP